MPDLLPAMTFGAGDVCDRVEPGGDNTRETGSGGARLDGQELGRDLALALHQVVVCLQAEEEALRKAEIAGEAQVAVGAHRALAVHQLVDPARRHVQRAPARSG